MKYTIAIAALLLATTAHAQNINGTTGSEANANGVGTANNAGNSMSLGLTSNNNSSGTIRNVPSLGGSAYGVSFSPKNCNSTVGATGVGPGAGGSIAMTSENEVCEDLLKADTLMNMAVNAHNIGTATLAKDPTNELGVDFLREAGALRGAAYDILCGTSIRTHKVMKARNLCSPIVDLLFAAGSTDPEQRGQYAP